LARLLNYSATESTTIMSLRSDGIYIQPKTRTRLFHILEIEKDKTRDELVTGATARITIDEIADRMLNERIEEVYPNIKSLEKKLDALTNQFRSELANPTSEEK